MRYLAFFCILVCFCGISPGPGHISVLNTSDLDTKIALTAPALWLDSSSNLELEPVAHYTAEDNLATTAVIDKSGNFAGTAARNTSVFSTASGKITRGFDCYTGSAGDRVSLGDMGGLTDYTVCAWAKPDSLGGGSVGRIFSANGDGVALRLTTDGSTGYKIILSSGTALTSSTIATTFDGVFHHVCGYRAGSVCGIYVDGASVVTPGDCGNTTIATEAWICDRSDGLRYFDGVVDDVRIYNRALTFNEINWIYNKGTGHQNQATNNARGAIVIDASNRVGAWQSRKNSYEYLQFTDANKPILGSLNGRRVLSFDGLAYYLQENVAVGQIFAGDDTALSLALVTKPASVAGAMRIFALEVAGAGDQPRYGWYYPANATVNVQRKDAAAASTVSATAASNLTGIVMLYGFNGARQTIFATGGGRDNDDSALGIFTGLNQSRIGAYYAPISGYYSGVIGPILLWNSYQKTTVEKEIHDGLASRFAVGGNYSMPTGF